MINFNLTNVLESDIKYNISKFPDGQQALNITNSRYDGINQDVVIKSRLNSFKDLEIIICANQALKNIGAKSVSLYVPYFLGSRSDRLFQEGGVNYLKQVICPIINLQGFNKVITLDPHSDVLEACLNNYEKINNFELVRFALTKIGNKGGAQERICLVSPDAGAYKKIFDVAKEFRINKIIAANKVRDLQTGDIIRTEIPILDQHNKLSYVIIDDICDGGRTFIELAKVIKDGRPTAKIYLIVTHGIFSNGFNSLLEYFDGIYCTNSVSDIDKINFNKVKQLNAFQYYKNI